MSDDRWICKKCRQQGFSPLKVKPYRKYRDEELYAVIHIFDGVVENDRYTDPDFYNYIDHPEGKHLVECSGHISNTKVVRLLRDIMQNVPDQKPKKWWQIWRRW